MTGLVCVRWLSATQDQGWQILCENVSWLIRHDWQRDVAAWEVSEYVSTDGHTVSDQSKQMYTKSCDNSDSSRAMLSRRNHNHPANNGTPGSSLLRSKFCCVRSHASFLTEWRKTLLDAQSLVRRKSGNKVRTGCEWSSASTRLVGESSPTFGSLPSTGVANMDYGYWLTTMFNAAAGTNRSQRIMSLHGHPRVSTAVERACTF